MKKKLMIFGGSGYVGSALINKLVKINKYEILNYDLDLFGSKHLPKNKITHIKGDVRDLIKIKRTIKKFQPNEILHLACISNDPSYLLNKSLSKDVNYVAFKKLINLLDTSDIEKFLYASTCSVYGVSNKKNITEDHPQKPLTEYNKFKGECEKILKNRKNENYSTCIIRPSTVCGVSTKMRLDLTVNILTNYAFNKGYIKIFGGQQKRPNLHIEDMIDLYCLLINKKNYSDCNNESFNAGGENLKISTIGNKEKKIVQKFKKKKINLIYEKSSDKRSYHVNGDKIKKYFGFKPKKTVEDAIKDLCFFFDKYEKKDTFTNKNFFNVKKLMSIKFK